LRIQRLIVEFAIDGTKLIKRDFASLVCSSLVWWTTLRSYIKESTKQIMTSV